MKGNQFMYVSIKNVAANELSIFMNGSIFKKGSMSSVDRVASKLTGKKFKNRSDMNWYLSRAEFSKMIKAQYPELSEKLRVMSAKLDEKFLNRYTMKGDDKINFLNEAVKELNVGRYINITR